VNGENYIDIKSIEEWRNVYAAQHQPYGDIIMHTNNTMLMNFINVMFPNGFSDTEEEYAVVYFNNNEGRGSRKINISENMITEIIDHATTLNANEVILVHSQPAGDLDTYPGSSDIDMFNTIEAGLTARTIAIYNNTIISKFTGEWHCTSFKDVGQPANFK